MLKKNVLFALAISLWLSPLRSESYAGLSLMAEPQLVGPCISSLMGPPMKGCAQWLANVDAVAVKQKSTLLTFMGSGDEYLHILDEKGRMRYQLATEGRVITKSLFNEDFSVFYFGTDKGIVYAVDAFSYKPVFTFTADSKLNDNFLLAKNHLIFTSALGTIYCLLPDGQLKWHIEQPLIVERLRLSQRSNILTYSGANDDLQLLVPHAEGYISVVDLEAGKVLKKIELGVGSSRFLDIVAPMAWLSGHLWVASYGLGIFAVDVSVGKVKRKIPETGVLDLVVKGEKLFAASADNLYAISSQGDILWKNEVSKLKTRTPKCAFPFNKLDRGAKRLFYGVPSLLLSKNKLIVSSSAGSVGIFDQTTGHLNQVIGNSVGFSSINWANDKILMVTKRGKLMESSNF